MFDTRHLTRVDYFQRGANDGCDRGYDGGQSNAISAWRTKVPRLRRQGCSFATCTPSVFGGSWRLQATRLNFIHRKTQCKQDFWDKVVMAHEYVASFVEQETPHRSWQSAVWGKAFAGDEPNCAESPLITPPITRHSGRTFDAGLRLLTERSATASSRSSQAARKLISTPHESIRGNVRQL